MFDSDYEDRFCPAPVVINRFWWLPLARRVVGWGLAMALLWSVPLLILLGAGLSGLDYWVSNANPSSTEESFYLDDLRLVGFILTFFISGFSALLGLITGVFIGFYAPPTEPKNPLQSHFFRTVGKRTFWFWLFSSFASAIGCGVLGYFLFYRLAWLGFWCGPSLVLFALSLWSALNHAIHHRDTEAQRK